MVSPMDSRDCDTGKSFYVIFHEKDLHMEICILSCKNAYKLFENNDESPMIANYRLVVKMMICYMGQTHHLIWVLLVEELSQL